MYIPGGGRKLSIATAIRKKRTKPGRRKARVLVQELKASADSTLKADTAVFDLSIPSVISSEFVLESGNTYHATTDVLVTTGGVLKHEPGVIVKWAQGTGLLVDADGVYIARGLPGQMCIHIPDTNDPNTGYWDGIRLEGGNVHTSLSEISYTYVAYPQDGFLLSDIALTKFENNFVEYGEKGIVSYGPRQTRILNNVTYWNQVGIFATAEDESGTIANPEYVIELTNNTCHENEYGFALFGTSNDLAVTTIMERNLSTASFVYNYSLWAGNLGSYFIPIFLDNGRWLKYAGSDNSNYDASSWEYNPVEDFSDPFDPGPDYFDIVRLKQTSAFIDASLTRVWESHQVGFTTGKNDIPDGNMIDLGYHYANWGYTSVGEPNLLCDFDGDFYIGENDLSLLLEYWLEPYFNPGEVNRASPDIDKDGVVTFRDYSLFAGEYLSADPNLLCDFDGDSVVDLKDLRIMTEYWLEPYFPDNIPLDMDEDGYITFKDFSFLAGEWLLTGQGLNCDFNGDSVVGIPDLLYMLDFWLEPYKLKTLPLDVDNDNFISFTDYCVLANEWRKHKGTECPSLTVSIMDGTYGRKVVTLSDYDQNSLVRLFLFVDGYYVKELFLDPYSPSTSRNIFVHWLESGMHQAKIIAFDNQLNLICYPLMEFTVSDGISEVLVPIVYEMGKTLPFSASSTLADDVRVSAWCANTEIWSSTFTSGSDIIGGVPPAITSDYEIDYIQFIPVQQESITKTIQLAGSGGKVAPAATADVNYTGTTALLVRPDFEINFTSGLADYIKDVLEQRGYKVKKLGFFTSSHYKIKKYRNKCTIKILYFTGHGQYKLKDVYRTRQELDDGIVVSDKVSNYDPISSAPDWLTPLDSPLEESVKTWKEINFNSLEFAAFDNCYSGRLRITGSLELVENTGPQVGYRNDLTKALNLMDDCPFLGWSHTYLSGYTSEFEIFSTNIWRKLRVQETLWEAIQYARGEAGYEQGRYPPEEFRFYGTGFIGEYKL